MKIKQTFFGLMGLMFLASSCQTNTDNIQGHLEGIGNDSLMVIQRYPGVRENSVDTIAALNGKFSINLKDSALSFVTIMELPKHNQAMRVMCAGKSFFLLSGN